MGAVRQNASPPCHLKHERRSTPSLLPQTACICINYNEPTQQEERGYVTEDDQARRPTNFESVVCKGKGDHECLGEGRYLALVTFPEQKGLVDEGG